MSTAIKVNGLCKRYESFYLDQLSFELPKGYIMGLVGENGAGKTTTLSAILNMIHLNNGQIEVFGQNTQTNEALAKQMIGVVFDDTFFAGHWRLWEVEKALSPFYTKWHHDTYSHYLDKFHLLPNKKVDDLSRGMKMKLMLAVALSHEAKLLILDEPTSGLDPFARDELLDVLADYISDGEKSVLFSTHISSDLEKIADYILLLSQGKTIYSGTKDELMEKYLVIKGSVAAATPLLQKEAIGLHIYKNGFTGMLPIEKKHLITADMFTEKPNLDDILVYMSKGAHAHE